MAKKINIKGINNRLIKTCPICGYTFRPFDPISKKETKKCPMCGYRFIKLNENSFNRDEFKKRFI